MLCPAVEPEGVGSPARRKNLTKDQRTEILRRLAAGETQVDIAKDYDVTRAAISRIKQTAADPKRFKRRDPLKKQLTDEEVATFKTALDQSVPGDHGLVFSDPGLPKFWTLARARALAKKLFGKEPSVRVLKECMGDHLTRRPDTWLTPPEPPGPRDIRKLPPELAADKEFVKYYLSPIALQIEQREYEQALEHYQKRQAEYESRQTAPPPPGPDGDDWEMPSLPASRQPIIPCRRVGKHAKGRGSPFTKSKRRKKKR
jgi:hypothetical protein